MFEGVNKTSFKSIMHNDNQNRSSPRVGLATKNRIRKWQIGEEFVLAIHFKHCRLGAIND
jgi:hypothetical protein